MSQFWNGECVPRVDSKVESDDVVPMQCDDLVASDSSSISDASELRQVEQWADRLGKDAAERHNRRRRKRYCRRCLHPLKKPAHCSLCGEGYDAHDPASYVAGGDFNYWTLWLPAFCASVVVGVLSYALLLSLSDDSLGMALFFAVPFSFGAMLGFMLRTPMSSTMFLVVICVPAVGLSLIYGPVGIFCGITLVLIFMIPACGGAVVGVILRLLMARLRSGGWQRVALLLSIVVLPLVVREFEVALVPAPEMATVRTAREFQVPRQAAWHSIIFYEEVEHAPPWLLRLALPRPLRSTGSRETVGDVVDCLYNRGHLTKRITELDEGRLLAFEVIEQDLHFERDVELIDGRFELEALGAARTRVVLETRYRRKLRPAWLWEPIERKVVHTLHDHVLEGMQRHARQLPIDSRDYHPIEIQRVPGMLAMRAGGGSS